VDTDVNQVDNMLRGYVRVVTGYREEMVDKIVQKLFNTYTDVNTTATLITRRFFSFLRKALGFKVSGTTFVKIRVHRARLWSTPER